MTFDKDKIPFKFIIDYKDDCPMKFLYDAIRYETMEHKDNFTKGEASLFSTSGNDRNIKALMDEGILKKINEGYIIAHNPWQ